MNSLAHWPIESDLSITRGKTSDCQLYIVGEEILRGTNGGGEVQGPPGEERRGEGFEQVVLMGLERKLRRGGGVALFINSLCRLHTRVGLH